MLSFCPVLKRKLTVPVPALVLVAVATLVVLIRKRFVPLVLTALNTGPPKLLAAKLVLAKFLIDALVKKIKSFTETPLALRLTAILLEPETVANLPIVPSVPTVTVLTIGVISCKTSLARRYNFCSVPKAFLYYYSAK